jgi:hypothetical protein
MDDADKSLKSARPFGAMLGHIQNEPQYYSIADDLPMAQCQGCIFADEPESRLAGVETKTIRRELKMIAFSGSFSSSLAEWHGTRTDQSSESDDLSTHIGQIVTESEINRAVARVIARNRSPGFCRVCILFRTMTRQN